MKKELLDKLEKLAEDLPPNTLDELIDELGGPENVAEVSWCAHLEIMMWFFSTVAIYYLSDCSKTVLSFFKVVCDLSIYWRKLVYQFYTIVSQG